MAWTLVALKLYHVHRMKTRLREDRRCASPYSIVQSLSRAGVDKSCTINEYTYQQ
ncbi:hypothetical protein SNOG_12063 [Parastagonospora nodorum SN15]|uniref:Uncharacterized protein n=1 Tax=Phaeosphaeria nodorum (strain SN15 / ATCC MYA-4574 / FGSC 10173) TaxID=321614 RepID=Q0U851_PHANO|nr:hypothetical protein SNOG_12063 [Parastagonospora nodorum SN15]EAT80475.1 hypothetical protein SNOG_12063 [Parastagonospora nodorum SN15]